MPWIISFTNEKQYPFSTKITTSTPLLLTQVFCQPHLTAEEMTDATSARHHEALSAFRVKRMRILRHLSKKYIKCNGIWNYAWLSVRDRSALYPLNDVQLLFLQHRNMVSSSSHPCQHLGLPLALTITSITHSFSSPSCNICVRSSLP